MRSPQVSGVEGKGKEELRVGTGPREGKGELLRYRVKASKRRQLRRKGRQAEGAGPRPLTWSPHAGVNHAARPAGLGEQLCHLPALSGGQALSAGSHPGRKPQGPPPSEGKILWPKGPPQEAADPKPCVCWGSGGSGAQDKQSLWEVLQQQPQPSSCLHQGKHIWNRACGSGREDGPMTTTTTLNPG